jgi:hypothetical protein
MYLTNFNEEVCRWTLLGVLLVSQKKAQSQAKEHTDTFFNNIAIKGDIVNLAN